ncbi:hypothetical protein [Mucilaginibacter sp. UR6-11]|uniref:hypothetical protein n=1 Tax=Mucilaginibacter sp. UR6-11 TaxID=1435644 RepID=UPI001E59A9BC|nr:hypothetical protein [Mucilaginibacter sp. UR6-11]MCC8426426.1 hypothetical protein [Mucilaginibacter sp. UR6-11]
MMSNNMDLTNEAKAWIRRKNKPDEVVRITRDSKDYEQVISYELYTAYDENPDYLGRILFDMQGYWIYDGDTLTITEQEQLAKFIINYAETF